MSFISKIDRDNGFIINYLTDTDFYKLTMLQFILHNFPWANSKYKFKCRTKGVDLAPYVSEIRREIDHLCTLKFQAFELEYLNKISFLTKDFIHFLRIFQLNPEWINVFAKDGNLCIEANGPWLYVMLFEIYILQIVQEVYTRNAFPNFDLTVGREKLNRKIQLVKEYVAQGKRFQYTDFGGRRRFSGIWHEETVATQAKELPSNIFIGSSNVLMAILYNIKVIGTMAHEIVQAGQALGPRPVHSQSFIFQKWANEFRGNLGIALTDTLGLDKFFKDFDMYFAKLYDGCRHDSGDPFQWGEKLIIHYDKLKINPMTKSAVFSDGLTMTDAFKLNEHFLNKILVSFGIGTHLTNDVGIKALQNVMKIVECQGKPVAKISDNPAKTMCDSLIYVENLKKEIVNDLECDEPNHLTY